MHWRTNDYSDVQPLQTATAMEDVELEQHGGHKSELYPKFSLVLKVDWEEYTYYEYVHNSHRCGRSDVESVFMIEQTSETATFIFSLR